MSVVHQVFVVLIMMNLLISLMTTTFARIQVIPLNQCFFNQGSAEHISSANSLLGSLKYHKKCILRLRPMIIDVFEVPLHVRLENTDSNSNILKPAAHDP